MKQINKNVFLFDTCSAFNKTKFQNNFCGLWDFVKKLTKNSNLNLYLNNSGWKYDFQLNQYLKENKLAKFDHNEFEIYFLSGYSHTTESITFGKNYNYPDYGWDGNKFVAILVKKDWADHNLFVQTIESSVKEWNELINSDQNENEYDFQTFKDDDYNLWFYNK